MAGTRQARAGSTAVAEQPRPANGRQEPQEAAKNRPVHEVRIGRICGAIWPQAGNDGRTWFNVTFSRIYRDNDQNWQRSDSFGRTDLPLVMKVADLCHTWIYQQAQDDNG